MEGDEFYCCRCDQPIPWDDEPHTDPELGADVHALCCPQCEPERALEYGLGFPFT